MEGHGWAPTAYESGCYQGEPGEPGTHCPDRILLGLNAITGEPVFAGVGQIAESLSVCRRALHHTERGGKV